MMLIVVTTFCALLTGGVGGWLLRGQKKRQHLPNGSALQSYAPVWANASHVKEMKR